MMSVNNAVQRIISSTVYRQCKIRNLCNSVIISKDTKQSSPDILLNRFKNAKSVQGVLDTCSQHKDVMNTKHIIQALKSVFELHKEGRSELSTKGILNSQQFIEICGKLKTLAGTINSVETIEALKFVTYVGVPKNSTIVQVLLQLLRNNINELNLQQIVFLNFLLTHYENVPLAEALKIALPIIFEIQLPIKMETENIRSLREYLQFASKHQFSDKSIELIVSNMTKCKPEYNIKTAKSIIWSLADLVPKCNFEPLLTKNLEILASHRDQLSLGDLDVTLRKLVTAYQKTQHLFFRNIVFCDHAANYMIDNNMGFKDCIYLMKKLNLLNVTNKSFIDFVSDKIAECKMNVDYDFYFYYIFLDYLSKTDYRPRNWDLILEKIKTMNKTPNLAKIETIKLAVILSYHQIFEEDMISQVFNQDFHPNFERSSAKGKRDLYSYLALYHSLKLYKPEFLNILPDSFNPVNYIEDLIKVDKFPLESALFSAFGGEKYVKSGLYSKEGIFIDHVILFRKGGYPVSTNSQCKFIEDLVIPEDNELVLILCLPSELYTEEKYLRKKCLFRLQLLKHLGYTVVPICLESWKSLLEYEKIPYLVQNVKNKLGPDMSVSKYA